MTDRQISDFQEIVWAFYQKNARSMPWRETPSPYFVMVSELMLQQTQVARVVPKFEAFIHAFPDMEALATASLPDVLRHWQGLGYNRRAKFLHEAARMVVDRYDGILPRSGDELMSLPGIGSNTAGAIMAYAFNQPVVFIETNIRTVYFHHFFADQEGIEDSDIEPLVRQTLDIEHPREWYWALMDYGVYLKSQRQGRISQSRHYKKQSRFEGSLRQMRGEIIRQLIDAPKSREGFNLELTQDERFESALDSLVRDELVSHDKGKWCLTGEASTS